MFPLKQAAASWIFLIICVFGLFKGGGSTENRVVCYYTNWSVYRPGTAKFNPQNINPYLCTHLIYAFGGFTKDNALKPFDKYQDIEQGGYAKFTGLKTYNKNLKTLLAIGGWNEGSSRFSALVASPDRRQQFARNTVKFLRQNHFDGLDLDWEYPAHRDGGKARDKDNYAQFVQELREEFERESSKTGRSRLLLTMAVPAGVQYIEKGYDIKKLNKYLDWFNLLTYDYHSAFEPSVNHHSPLYSLEEESEYNYDSELNIDYSVKFYLNEGADRDKIVLGLPTYGRSYTLLNPEATDIGAPADGPGEQGDATREKGYLAYYEICQNIRNDEDWTVVQPNPDAMGPYIYKDNQWIGYDDEAIARKKAKYVVANGLGGIMFWSIDNDDFRGVCNGKPYPLIEAAKEAMLNPQGSDNEIEVTATRGKPNRQRSRPVSTNRISSQSKDDDAQSGRKKIGDSSRNKKIPTLTSEPKIRIAGRTTTPQPPTTPDPGADFKCHDEGFYPHPRDCKKYFWCLDSGPSNLGIVAHQFTCPSGLIFNKETDSCDYTRNVVCKIERTTLASVTEASTKFTTTERSAGRATMATSKTTLLRRPTTTTTSTGSPFDNEYEYEDEEENSAKGESQDEEEDPKVIKELIDLIKKVGGLEELEKQLQKQEESSNIADSSKLSQSSTPSNLISKSLYDRVLNTGARNFNPNNRYTSLFSKLSQRNNSSTSTNTDTSFDVKSNSENKYSSVIRNSRPNAQNAGIEELSEFQGLFRERPQYVTINRSTNSQRRRESEDTTDANLDEEKYSELILTTLATTPNRYVNIKRNRGTTTTIESTEDDQNQNTNDDESVTKKTYGNDFHGHPIQQQQQQQQQQEQQNSEIFNEDNSSTNRYKTIQRGRSTTTTESTNSELIDADENDRLNEDEASEPTTVAQLSLYKLSLDDTSTRVYANIARRTTESLQLTNTNELTPSTTDTATIITSQFTVTSTTTTPRKSNEKTDTNNDEHITTINSNTDTDIGLLEELTTTSSLDTDNIQNEVTTYNPLESQNENSIAQTTDNPTSVNNNVNASESPLTTASNPNLIEKITTDTKTFEKNNKNDVIEAEVSKAPEILATVSSPRPFGFSKRTRRPISGPSSTSTSTITTSSSISSPSPVKVSSFQFSNLERPSSSLLNLSYTSDGTSSNDQASVDTDTKQVSGMTLKNDSESSHDNDHSTQSTPNSASHTRASIRGRIDRNRARLTTKSDYIPSTQRPDDDFETSATHRTRNIPQRRFRPRFDDVIESIERTTTPIVRPLRPTIESDLSSLTAGDFYKYHKNSGQTRSRRIWPSRGTTAAPVANEERVLDGNAPSNVRKLSGRRGNFQRPGAQKLAIGNTRSDQDQIKTEKEQSSVEKERSVNLLGANQYATLHENNNMYKGTNSPIIFLNSRSTTLGSTISSTTNEDEQTTTTLLLHPLLALNSIDTTITPDFSLDQNTEIESLATNIPDITTPSSIQYSNLSEAYTIRQPISKASHLQSEFVGRPVRVRNRFRISSIRDQVQNANENQLVTNDFSENPYRKKLPVNSQSLANIDADEKEVNTERGEDFIFTTTEGDDLDANNSKEESISTEYPSKLDKESIPKTRQIVRGRRPLFGGRTATTLSVPAIENGEESPETVHPLKKVIRTRKPLLKKIEEQNPNETIEKVSNIFERTELLNKGIAQRTRSNAFANRRRVPLIRTQLEEVDQNPSDDEPVYKEETIKNERFPLNLSVGRRRIAQNRGRIEETDERQSNGKNSQNERVKPNLSAIRRRIVQRPRDEVQNNAEEEQLYEAPIRNERIRPDLYQSNQKIPRSRSQNDKPEINEREKSISFEEESPEQEKHPILLAGRTRPESKFLKEEQQTEESLQNENNSEEITTSPVSNEDEEHHIKKDDEETRRSSSRQRISSSRPEYIPKKLTSSSLLQSSSAIPTTPTRKTFRLAVKKILKTEASKGEEPSLNVSPFSPRQNRFQNTHKPTTSNELEENEEIDNDETSEILPKVRPTSGFRPGARRLPNRPVYKTAEADRNQPHTNNEEVGNIRPVFRPTFRRPSYKSPSSTPSTTTTATEETKSSTSYGYNRRRMRPTTGTYSTKSTTLITTEKNDPQIPVRRKFIRPSTNEKRRFISTTTSTTPEPTTRFTNSLFRRRIGLSSTSRRPLFATTTEKIIDHIIESTLPESDQKLEPSIQDNKFTNNRFNQLGEPLTDDVVEAITTISKAPIPNYVITTTPRHFNRTTYGKPEEVNNGLSKQITKRIGISSTTRKTVIKKRKKPDFPVEPPKDEYLLKRKPQPFERRQRLDFDVDVRTEKVHHKPILEYDYYDDEDVRIVGNSNSKVKVILHDGGIIECLDQGNFPHPLSCRKFISCAKMETGGVIGWEYTCPKGLSYDPVGGICNWAAGLGCKE